MSQFGDIDDFEAVDDESTTVAGTIRRNNPHLLRPPRPLRVPLHLKSLTKKEMRMKAEDMALFLERAEALAQNDIDRVNQIDQKIMALPMPRKIKSTIETRRLKKTEPLRTLGKSREIKIKKCFDDFIQGMLKRNRRYVGGMVGNRQDYQIRNLRVEIEAPLKKLISKNQTLYTRPIYWKFCRHSPAEEEICRIRRLRKYNKNKILNSKSWANDDLVAAKKMLELLSKWDRKSPAISNEIYHLAFGLIDTIKNSLSKNATKQEKKRLTKEAQELWRQLKKMKLPTTKLLPAMNAVDT